MADDKPALESSESDDTKEDEYLVERIMDSRSRKGRVEYLIKWEGYDSDNNTWEPRDNLNCAALIKEYEGKEAEKRKLLSKMYPTPGKRPNRSSNNNLPRYTSPGSSTTPDTDDTVEILEKRPTKSRKLLEKVNEAPEAVLVPKDKFNLDKIVGLMIDDEEKLFAMVRLRTRVKNIDIIPVEQLEEKAPKELCAWYRQRLYEDKQAIDLFKPIEG